jgi:PAS domain S-box-containing protein
MKQVELMKNHIKSISIFLLFLSLFFSYGCERNINRKDGVDKLKSDAIDFMTLQPEEKIWIEENKLTFSSCLEAPPLGFTNQNGEYEGMGVDLANLIVGHFQIEANWICEKSYEKTVKRSLAGEISMIIMQETPERSRYFNFTKPIFDLPYVLITRRSNKNQLRLEDLAGQTVTVVKSYLVETYIKKNYPEVLINAVPDSISGLMQVSMGESEIFAGNLAYSSWLIENKGITNLRSAGETGFINRSSIAIPKNNPILFSIMQKFFDSVSDEELTEIRNRWIHLEEEHGLDKKYLTLIIGLASAILILILLIAVWNYLLRRTVRKQTLLIRENEERLNLAMSVANDGIWDWHLKSNKIYFDPRYYTMAGYEPYEFPETFEQWEKRIHPDEVPLTGQMVEAYLSGKCDKFNIEFRFKCKNGDYIWIRSRGKIVTFDQHGNPVRFIGTHSDITERKLAEENLESARNYIFSIINSMPSILVGIDPEGNVTQWNNEAEKATGVSVDESVGKPLPDVFPRLTSEMDRVREALETRQVLYEPKKTIQIDGEVRYEDVTIYPLTTAGEEGAVIRIDDVTEKVRLEEMMIQSEKMLSIGELAAGMAHEINNPMAGIMQTADVLRNRLADANMPANIRIADEVGANMETIQAFMEKRKVLTMLSNIHESGMRVVDIIANTLSFSRKSVPEFKKCNLAELVDRSLELAATDYDLKKQYDFKSIRIVREYNDNLPLVPCEKAKIQQVLLNILKNGSQAMRNNLTNGNGSPPCFCLRLTTDSTNGMFSMEIEDNGPGMDEKTRRRVFEPFFTTKPEGEGTGLGLSVSYFIITKNHMGELSVESTPGKGTRFTIKLPLQREV